MSKLPSYLISSLLSLSVRPNANRPRTTIGETRVHPLVHQRRPANFSFRSALVFHRTKICQESVRMMTMVKHGESTFHGRMSWIRCL
ncbi:hypothetical protein LINPERHAP1_LOCUS31511 [Linum perenne]